MSVLKLYSSNPKDGVTSFNQVRFYEADDTNGTNAAVIATEDIDTTNKGLIDAGFTSSVYASGSTSKYYASTWYNSTNTTETDKSNYIQGGQDRWDKMFMDELKDTSSAVWSSTDRGYFKTKALEALFPDFFYESIDTSQTVVNDSTTQTKTYALPFGAFYVAEVGVGNPDNESTYPFKIVVPENWKVEQNKLVLASLSGLTDDYPIRLVCSKKYMDVGEVPERLDPLVMIHLRMSAYQQMVDDYPRFLQWSRLQTGTKVTFEGLKLLVRELGVRFNAEKERQKSLAMSVSI